MTTSDRDRFLYLKSKSPRTTSEEGQLKSLEFQVALDRAKLPPGTSLEQYLDMIKKGEL